MARAVLSRSGAEVLERARQKRNQLLAETDWTQAPDNRLSEDQRQAYADCREQWRSVVDDLKAGMPPRPWAEPPEA